MKKLAIFDMDGTILNTIEDITAAVNYILCKYNMPLRTVDEVKFFVGNGLKKTLSRSVPKDTPENIIDEMFPEFTSYYKDHSKDNTRPYEGIVEVISHLKKEGYLLSVVSNKRHEAVLKLCDECFKDLFDIAIGDQDGINIKPAPDMVDLVLKELNVDRKDAVYIGDSDVDLQTAKNSNLDCIAVSWGFRDRAFLVEHGAKVIVDTTEQLENILI